MALDKAGLKMAIKVILIELATKETDQPGGIDEFAEKLSTAIDNFVRTGTVNTVGSASAQVGTIS